MAATDSFRPAWLSTLVLALAAAAFAIAATFVMFSAFMYYDDEGYVLLSLRNYAAHGGLYREVYSQYGPFPFVFYHALQALGIPLTHTVGRVITLGAWTGTAVACAALAGYATRSLVARVAVLASVFVYLWVMASEPTHPGGLIVVLTAILAAVGYKWIATGILRAWAILAGAITAALLLTKINIGAFAAFSAGAWWLLHHRDDRLRRWAPWLVGAAAVALPLGLMRPLLGTAWVQDYAVAFACAGLALSAVAAIGATARTDARDLAAGLVSAALIAALVVGSVLLRGTTPHDLLEGLLLGPLRHPANFSLPYHWPPGIRVIAAVSLVAAATACALRPRANVGVDVAIATARLIAVTILAYHLCHYPTIGPDQFTFGWVLPFLWLFAWPLAGNETKSNQARIWLAFLLLGQCLHAFPVPGSQIAWGSVLALPLAAIGAWDAAAWLARRNGATRPLPPAMTWALPALVIGFTALIAWNFSKVAGRYRQGENLGLPGAEMIRLPERSSALFRVLTLNAVAHADVLFSLPGMYSLNLWTDLPTPTRANVTHWFSLLDDTRQQAIVEALKAAPRACVIIDRGHVEFLTERGLKPKGRLLDYLTAEFEPAFTVDRFDFCVHRGRRIEPYLLGDLRVSAAAAEVARTESALLTFNVLVPTREPISTIEFTAATGALPVTLNAANARVEFTPALTRGQTISAARTTSWPVQWSGAGTVSVYYDRERQPAAAPEATIVWRDATGAEIGLARIRR